MASQCQALISPLNPFHLFPKLHMMYVFRQKQRLLEPLKAQAKSKDDFLIAGDAHQPWWEKYNILSLTFI